MSADERAIREWLAAWFEATAKGDLSRLLSMLTEDVVFLTPGRPPFGRDAFAAGFSSGRQQNQITCAGEFEEVVVAGDVAYTRGRLAVTMTPLTGGKSIQLTGYTLTVFSKQADGRWLLARDANLLSPTTGGPA